MRGPSITPLYPVNSPPALCGRAKKSLSLLSPQPHHYTDLAVSASWLVTFSLIRLNLLQPSQFLHSTWPFSKQRVPFRSSRERIQLPSGYININTVIPKGIRDSIQDKWLLGQGLGISEERLLLELHDPWRWKRHVPSKRRETITLLLSVTTQKTWNLKAESRGKTRHWPVEQLSAFSDGPQYNDGGN